MYAKDHYINLQENSASIRKESFVLIPKYCVNSKIPHRVKTQSFAFNRDTLQLNAIFLV